MKLSMTALVCGLFLVRCTANSAPSIVGRWIAIEGSNESLELGADGSMRTATGGTAYNGVYKFSGRALTYTMITPGGPRTVTMSVPSLADNELVLESNLTGHRTIYRRPGGDPPPVGTSSQYPKLILGQWKNTAYDEVLTFTPDGRLSITMNGRQYSAVYEVQDATLEYSLAQNPHTTVMTILSLDRAGLRMLGKTREAQYQRVR